MGRKALGEQDIQQISAMVSEINTEVRPYVGLLLTIQFERGKGTGARPQEYMLETISGILCRGMEYLLTAAEANSARHINSEYFFAPAKQVLEALYRQEQIKQYGSVLRSFPVSNDAFRYFGMHWRRSPFITHLLREMAGKEATPQRVH